MVELAIANMHEVEAIGELLEQKVLLTKQKIFSLAKGLKRKAPFADHAKTLLGRIIQLLEWGKPSTPDTMH